MREALVQSQPERASPGPTIRTVIAEDTYLVRQALVQMLAGVSRVEVVRICADRDSLMDAIDQERPDAVVTDIRMPPAGTDEGIQVARWLRRKHPNVGVVVLSHFSDPEYVLELLESGSAGRAYLLKDRLNDVNQLVAAIETVVDGGSVIDPKVVEALAAARAVGVNSPLADLTTRELDVLAEVAQGKSNAAIAQSLVLTKRAVEKHINSIFMKLHLGSPEDVSRRVMASLLFLAAGPDRPGEDELS